MKLIATILAAGSALTLSSPAISQDYKADSKVDVVQTNSRGQATQVRIEGKIYAVCMSDKQDSCINPRAAGLKFGNRPLAYWPGKPASEG